MTTTPDPPIPVAPRRHLALSVVQIYLIRHGETAWSASGQYTGRTDLSLTPLGAEQAHRLCARLSTVRFAHVWVSPRLRARQTCRLAGLQARARVEPDLAEWDYGEYEGRRARDIRRERPGWDVWQDGCPGGESPADIQARADRLVERLLTLAGPVALFSHGQLARALASRWIGLEASEGRHFALDPATVSILGQRSDRPEQRVIMQWNAAPFIPVPVSPAYAG